MSLRKPTPFHRANPTYENTDIQGSPQNIMYFFLCFLLLATYCFSTTKAINIVDYLPIGAHGDSIKTEAERMTIVLPQGFKPQAPPFKPMLLPFGTPAPSSPSGGWKPIIGDAVTPPHNIVMPPPAPLVPPPLVMLQDRIDTVSREQSVEPENGPVLESIVYGTWKPERPLRPDEMHMPVMRSATPTLAVYTRKRPTSSLEHLGIQHQITDTQDTGAKFNEPTAHRRISTTRAHHSVATPPKYINVNISDPNLLEMAKNGHSQKMNTWPQWTSEISIDNESEIKTEIQKEFEVETDTETEMTTETLTNDIGKVWPTDFIASLEQGTKQKEARKNVTYTFLGDSSDPPLASGRLNIPNPLLPKLPPFNITKVGIPYEKQNSAEEPTICVPLIVLEELSQLEVIEMERVYCFPLPPPQKGSPKPKYVTSKVENFTEYEAVNASPRIRLNYINILGISTIILILIKLEYS
ncbi:uncharacterized protein LOC128867352 [Anastrepha ludens]|uniref:uncharacterized protein LOC128867352 n=1 Tax=Anastrepha ludens TaxID=28586 RepID=UPI0023AFE9E9|nr:uncharacterized protein LOC128867352 [Anastrepha ludens]XP_053964475.1 uncharacterized protein LOC128867352 [Anastrepha ludens]